MNLKKRIVKYSLVLLFLLMNKTLLAHNPDASSIIISRTDSGQVILQISSSLTAFQQEVNFINGQGAYQSPEEFKKLVINHFNNTFSIVINKKDTLTFKNPKVFLGHETKLISEIIGLPENIESIQLKNEVFKDIYRNQSVVIFLMDGFPKEKFTINAETKQEVNIALKNGNWVHVNKVVTNKNPNYFIFLGGLLVLVFIIYFLVNRNFKK